MKFFSEIATETLRFELNHVKHETSTAISRKQHKIAEIAWAELRIDHRTIVIKTALKDKREKVLNMGNEHEI